MHLNDSSLFCVFTSLEVTCSPNSLFMTDKLSQGAPQTINSTTMIWRTISVIFLLINLPPVTTKQGEKITFSD